VSNAFVQLSPELAAACEQGVVLTPTQRLRRNLTRAYDAAQLAAGRGAWPTANVHNLEGYLRHRYARLRLFEPSLPRLLSREAEFLLFRQTAAAGGEPLVTLARQAWQTCHDWHIPIDEQSLSATENGRLFLAWARRLRDALGEINAITQAELAAHLVAHTQVPEPTIVCHSFANMPLAIQSWLAHLEDLGSEVRHFTPVDHATGTTQRLSFDTTSAELSAVAQWSRQLLRAAEARNDELKIGIVIPDLAQRYSAVIRQFTAELNPLPGPHGLTEAPFDIGGGLAIVEQPIWQIAADWLSLCYGRLATVKARCVFDSGYLELPATGRWPVYLAEPCSLADIVQVSDNEQLRTLLANLPSDRSRRLGEWAECFEKVLLAAGWSGKGTGSNQFQAYQHLRGHLEACRSGTQPQHALPALETIQRLLGTLTFAVERQAAPIQIMGYLETTGLDFSHLWVTGLDDRSWPRPVQTNPLIPLSACLAAGVPRVTPDLELTFARQRLKHWQDATQGEVFYSHAANDGDSQLEPSPLVAGLAAANLPQLTPERPHPYFDASAGMLEAYPQTSGRAVELGHRRGGTGLLRDQAQCPFRGWAIHRLGLAEIRKPHTFPDALDRGTLIHDALHRLYLDTNQRPRNPDTITPADIEPAVVGALNRHYRRYPEKFRATERERLARLLETWLQLDVARNNMLVVDLEVAQEIELEGIRLNLRIDRVEQIGDTGALVVVDYKSGRVSNRLAEPRLAEPQLPIYALANSAIRGVLYAQLDETQPRLLGMADADLGLAPARLAAPLDGDWQKQLERWREQLGELVREIQSGHATVTPLSAQVCRNCHLQDFCRLSSLQMDADS